MRTQTTKPIETIDPARIEAQLRKELEIVRRWNRLESSGEDLEELRGDWHGVRILAYQAMGRAQALAWAIGSRSDFKKRYGELAFELSEAEELLRDFRTAKKRRRH